MTAKKPMTSADMARRRWAKAGKEKMLEHLSAAGKLGGAATWDGMSEEEKSKIMSRRRKKGLRKKR